MKKVFIIIWASLLGISLIGCGGKICIPSEKPVVDTIGDRAFLVITENDNQIIVDIETKVQYLYLDIESNSSGLEVIVDEDGKPILYEDDLSWEYIQELTED